MGTATESVWWVDGNVPSGNSAETWGPVDVCVVGAGIAGLTTAYLLAKSGLQVLVLDARSRVGSGETSVTTAHLASVLDDRFSRLRSIRGPEVARMAYESHARAIDRIEQITREEQIECDFERLEGYLVPGTHSGTGPVEEEAEALEALKIPFERTDRCLYPQFAVGPCLRFADQGQFHPLKYLNGLARAFMRLGGAVRTGCRVEQVESGPNCIVRLHNRSAIQARQVVIATHSPIHAGVSLSTRLAPYTTYAIAAGIPAGSVANGLFWDTDDPYHYIRRQAAQGSSGVEYLIVGGQDHKTGQADDPGEHWDRLEAWTRTRFPEVIEVRHRWSGQVLETLDGLALIGPDLDRGENVFIATGDSGMGMTHGTIAGMLLTDLILGRSNPWAELYAPGRTLMSATGTYLSENANVAAQYTDWVTGGDVSSADEVLPGHGAILRLGLSKVAVYRDAKGTAHTLSAVCPHMGCVVRWNQGEQTWDCPCHGSRFAATGEVLHGPAVDDLKPANGKEP